MRLSGDLDQALLLLTDEVLEQLRTEGWPVEPGDLGENVTLTGISEGCLGPGARLRFGEVLVEITIPCDPCTELYVLPYVGPGRGPAFIRTLAGRRGWYARVLHVGTIEVGMVVDLPKTPSSSTAAGTGDAE
jgi:MOSC domain-containing protein YiiM